MSFAPARETPAAATLGDPPDGHASTSAADSNPWQPLLDGGTAQRAWDAVLAVAEALRDPAGVELAALGPDLSRGHCGRALFFTYLAAGLDEPAWREAAEEALGAAVATLAVQAPGPALLSGFTGVGWTLEHLAGRLYSAEEAADATSDIDEVVLQLVDGRWTGPYDWVSGLAGFGVYALEGLPRPGARRCLEGVLRQLHQHSEADADGQHRTWWTAPHLLPEHQRREAPDGYYNLGLAHGVAGVIALLAQARWAGVEIDGQREDLEAAVAWLLTRDRGPEAESRFANWLPGSSGHMEGVADTASELTRLAWCYGDLGIAGALRVAADVADGPHRSSWETAAVSLALRAAARPRDRSGVRDAALCHGAGGLALIFHRFAHHHGDGTFAEAAREAYRLMLDLRRPGEGVGGFKAWTPSRGGWEMDSGFLTGAAGVGLALLAGLTPVEPRWDRLLGLSARFSQAEVREDFP